MRRLILPGALTALLLAAIASAAVAPSPVEMVRTYDHELVVKLVPAP